MRRRRVHGGVKNDPRFMCASDYPTSLEAPTAGEAYLATALYFHSKKMPSSAMHYFRKYSTS